MRILGSLFYGREGSYDPLGIRLIFEEGLRSKPPFHGDSYIASLSNRCLASRFLRVLTLAYCHVCVHEIGHALAYKFFTGENCSVNIETESGTGSALLGEKYLEEASWKQSVIDFSGPMFNIGFSTIQIVSANALKNYVSRPVALLLAGGAALWISGELAYAYVSIKDSEDPDTDFGGIASRKGSHLLVACTVLVGQTALAVISLNQLIK